MYKRIISIILCGLLLFACQTRPKKINHLDAIGLVETPLGSSSYQVKHPNTMRLSVDEYRKVTDDHAFVFSKPDSLPPYSNVFAIGLNVPDSARALGFDLAVSHQAQSEVLGIVINWNVRKSDAGYFVADARHRDMRFLATSVTQTGLDSMIGLVSTLSYR